MPDHRLRPHPTTARVITAIGPAQDEITPAVARTWADLEGFAARFEHSVEVYSPDPGEVIAVLAPFLAEGCVVAMFALDDDEHRDAELIVDGAFVTARLVGAYGPDAVRPARAVRHLVAFALPETALPAGFELVASLAAD